MAPRNSSRGAMMARLALLVGICLICSGSYYACSFNSGGTSAAAGGADQGFKSTLILRDSTGMESASFVMGEPIRFDFEIRNDSSATVPVQFNDAQNYDFVVIDAATRRVRWLWSQGQAFTQVTTTLTFAPNASKSFSVMWNGVLGDGSQLPVGSYQARGVMLFDAFATDPLAPHSMGSPLVPFIVR